VLSARGRLLDGHNRLEALLAAGRKNISIDDVKIDRKAVDPESEALAAIRYQRVRRQSTMGDNAEVAANLMQRFGWSRSMVAEKMGVSRSAVTQWFGARPDLEVPTEVTGKDGRTYDTTNLVAEDEDQSTADEPIKRTRSTVKPGQAVIVATDKYAAQITDPELRAWITDHADAEDYESLSLKWGEISRSAGIIAADLEAKTHEGDGDEPFAAVAVR
jgi:hypothetical protein